MTESVTNPASGAMGTSPASVHPHTPGVTAATTVTAHFKMVFICVTVITVLALMASLYIGIFVVKPTEAAKSAMNTCTTLANLGFGAMVGLLGGKAVN